MKKTKVGTQCGTCAKFAFALFKELKAAKDADDKKKDDSDATEQP